MALQVEITGRNMEVTDRLNEYVTKKASKLDRYLNEIDEARVDLGAALAIARELSLPGTEVAATAHLARLPGGDVRIYYPQALKADELAVMIRQAVPGIAAPNETAAAAATLSDSSPPGWAMRTASAALSCKTAATPSSSPSPGAATCSRNTNAT